MKIIPTEWIWMNGKMVKWEDADFHIINHGLHYGGAVFEGLRAYNGKIFKLTEHSQRLIDSGETIGMPLTYSVEELNIATQAIVNDNGLKDCYIRPIAWRGNEEMGIGATGCSTQVAIAAWEWPSYFDASNGITLKTSKWKKPAPDTAPTSSKCAAGYVIGTMAKHDATKHGYHDALMYDYRGYIAEISAANIFMVKDGKLSTPIADCFLNGITRQTVIQMCKDNGLSIEETRIKPEELMTADEIFVTGTAVEIMPVSKIDNTDFQIGEITKKLIGLYKAKTTELLE